jgi:hypothetical protein
VPPLAPTIRSVWLIVCEKLSRMPTRTFSTPTRSVTLNAIEATVSTVVRRRLRSDFAARIRGQHHQRLMFPVGPVGDPVQLRKRQSRGRREGGGSGRG